MPIQVLRKGMQYKYVTLTKKEFEERKKRFVGYTFVGTFRSVADAKIALGAPEYQPAPRFSNRYKTTSFYG